MRLLRRGAVLLTALAILAPAAQAQTITPPGTAISGTAPNPTLTYGAATIKCDTGTFSGTTKNPAATSVETTLTFSGNCNISGLGAKVDCVNRILFTASGAATSGTINLNSNFVCVAVVSGVCQVTIAGPQVTGNTGTLNEGATTLTATVTVNATRTGSSLCGPASGPASFTASYNVTPNTLVIT